MKFINSLFTFFLLSIAAFAASEGESILNLTKDRGQVYDHNYSLRQVSLPSATKAMVFPIFDPESLKQGLKMGVSPGLMVNDIHHIKTTLRLVVGMYANHGLRISDSPLIIRPYVPFKAFNAFYDPSDTSLNFFIYPRGEVAVFSCRSLDTASHESGHWILDLIRPDFLRSKRPHVFALHETFGDFTAIFLRALYGITPPSSTSSTCLASDIGECVRKAMNPLIIAKFLESPKTCEPHNLSSIFTGAVFDAFETTVSETDIKSRSIIASNFIHSYYNAFVSAPEDPSSIDVARLMIDYTFDPRIRDNMAMSFLYKGFMVLEIDRSLRLNLHFNPEAVGFCDKYAEHKEGEAIRLALSSRKNMSRKHKTLHRSLGQVAW